MAKNYSNTKENALPVSINDIRDRYFAGEKLTEQELIAIANYDKYRLAHLNEAENETEFDKRYFQLQVMANLHPFSDFLDFDSIGK